MRAPETAVLATPTLATPIILFWRSMLVLHGELLVRCAILRRVAEYPVRFPDHDGAFLTPKSARV